MALTSSQYQRYSRHLSLPEFGEKGQEKLINSSVLLIGAGGLGSPLALYLAGAGVGRIGIMDFDVVDLSNLQRQIMHRVQDIGTSKAQSAKRAILDLNPTIQVETYEEGITSANAMEIIAKYQVVIDGTDNFPTRYLVNDACVFLKKINIYGSIYRFEGQATVFDASIGPCYRCLYPEPPPPGEVPSCAEGGVLGVLPGMVAMIQATEAIKVLTGMGETLVGRFLAFDALGMRFRERRIRKSKDCPVCGEKPSITALIDYQQFCGIGRGEASSTWMTWRSRSPTTRPCASVARSTCSLTCASRPSSRSARSRATSTSRSARCLPAWARSPPGRTSWWCCSASPDGGAWSRSTSWPRTASRS